MKTLSLHQPWATLCVPLAPGEKAVKPIETRGWSTKYRGRLLIHAAQRVPTPERGPLFVGDFHVAQGGTWLHGREFDLRMPFGAIVGSCELVDVVPIVDWGYFGDAPYVRVDSDGAGRPLMLRTKNVDLHDENVGPWPDNIDDQRPYGDFTPGRFAWLFEDAERTDERCPACWGVKNADFDVVATTRLWEQLGVSQAQIDALLTGESWVGSPCPACDGKGSCNPIPAKGKQGLWEWMPAIPRTA